MANGKPITTNAGNAEFFWAPARGVGGEMEHRITNEFSYLPLQTAAQIFT